MSMAVDVTMLAKAATGKMLSFILREDGLSVWFQVSGVVVIAVNEARYSLMNVVH
jgi:hypothetical protein